MLGNPGESWLRCGKTILGRRVALLAGGTACGGNSDGSGGTSAGFAAHVGARHNISTEKPRAKRVGIEVGNLAVSRLSGKRIVSLAPLEILSKTDRFSPRKECCAGECAR